MTTPDPANTPGATLPPFLRALLTRVTPPAELSYLLDDLSEEFNARARTTTHPRATCWLYSQTIRSLGPLALVRLRARRAERATFTSGDPLLAIRAE